MVYCMYLVNQVPNPNGHILIVEKSSLTMYEEAIVTCIVHIVFPQSDAATNIFSLFVLCDYYLRTV